MKNARQEAERLGAFVIERALAEIPHGFSKERNPESAHSIEIVKPLLAAGYVEAAGDKTWEDASVSHYFKATPAGIKWWIDQRVAGAQESHATSPKWFNIDPAILIEQVTGKGIGSHITFYCGSMYGSAVFVALRDRLFDFVSHRNYYPTGSMEEYVTVSLTRKGMAFFDAIPQLELECA